MTVQQQRFCPLCDRSFTEGEAVLRCEGCGVMQHPGCWVRNDGCATRGEHRRTPVAQAYTTVRAAGSASVRPGEGTRVHTPAAPETDDLREPLPIVRRQRAAQPPAAEEPIIRDDAAEAPVVGEPDAPPLAPRLRPQAEAELPPVAPHAPHRYQPPPDGGPAPRKPLPRVYGRHPVIAYWYVPVAVVLAVAVAFAVIWVAEQFTGGDGDTAATVTPGSPTLSSANTSPTPAAASPTPALSSSATAAATQGPVTGKFKPGDVLVVTGAGDCLNVRVEAGLPTAEHPNDAIVCLPDGAEVTVTGGPRDASGLHWWLLRTPQGEGWAAEDYLVRK